MKRLFPEVPAGHPAMGEMVMNFSANMLGLDNAATPFALKAMKSLQDINPKKETASNAQIMFLVLHTSGLTLIPLSIIAYRIAAHSAEAASIFVPCVAGTLCTTIAAVIVTGIWQKIKWDAVLIGWLLAITVLIGGALYYISSLSDEQKNIFSNISGNLVLLVIIITIIVGGAIKKVQVFDTFIEGAKEGFGVILKIIPFLVAMLVGIRVFRDCGALGYITDGIGYVVKSLGFNTAFVPSLPVALMKPFSGSGARGLMLDIFKKSLVWA